MQIKRSLSKTVAVLFRRNPTRDVTEHLSPSDDDLKWNLFRKVGRTWLVLFLHGHVWGFPVKGRDCIETWHSLKKVFLCLVFLTPIIYYLLQQIFLECTKSTPIDKHLSKRFSRWTNEKQGNKWVSFICIQITPFQIGACWLWVSEGCSIDSAKIVAIVAQEIIVYIQKSYFLPSPYVYALWSGFVLRVKRRPPYFCRLLRSARDPDTSHTTQSLILRVERRDSVATVSSILCPLIFGTSYTNRE